MPPITTIETRCYVLDTSIVRGLAGAAIKQARAGGVRLAVAITAFWEIAKHLDEDYSKFRSILLKIRGLEILNDPSLASNMRTDGQMASVPDLRVRQVENILDRLLVSTTYDQLNHNLRDLTMKGGLAERAREHFKRKQALYALYIPVVLTLLDQIDAANGGDADLHAAILKGLEARTAIVAENTPLSVDVVHEVRMQSYLHFGYTVERALELRQKAGKKLEPNDFVDGLICWSLRRDRPMTLVSGDKGMRAAVQRILERLQRIGEPCLINVLDQEELMSRISAVATSSAHADEDASGH